MIKVYQSSTFALSTLHIKYLCINGMDDWAARKSKAKNIAIFWLCSNLRLPNEMKNHENGRDSFQLTPLRLK